MQTKHNMKVCVVEPRGSGGMIHYAYQLCNALAGHGTEVTLVTAKRYELENYPHSFHVNKLLDLWTHSAPFFESAPTNGVIKFLRKLLHNLRRIGRGARYIFQWIKLAHYLMSTQPDIVQFGSIEFPFEALFLGYLKSRGLTLAQIGHEFEPRERSNSPLVRLNNYFLSNVFKAFSVIFFHSESNRQRFHSLYPEIDLTSSHIIPMGNGQIFPVSNDFSAIQNSLKERYGLCGCEPIVLFFGNITPSKGVDDLLNAFARVHAEKKEAKLIIAGTPLKYIDMDTLTGLAADLGIQPVTVFDTRYLPLEEIRPLIELATVVAYPYVSSTQSASIQAAYACGKPVVATRVGGLPDLVEDGKSGFLVSPRSPDELSRAILKIIRDPEMAKQLGSFARELSETRFSWTPIAGEIARAYETLLASNDASRL